MERARLVTDFFLIAHDEFSGRRRINADLLGCGLVGAQLADLVAAERAVVETGHLLITDAQGDGSDEVGSYVAERIKRQTGSRPVPFWIDTFRDELPDLIALELIAEGVVRCEPSGRRLRRRAERYPATDLLAAARPRLRLEHMLRNPEEFDLVGAVLAVLVGALRIESVLDPELDRGAARELIGRLETHLPADLPALVEGVRAAVAAISLTFRR